MGPRHIVDKDLNINSKHLRDNPIKSQAWYIYLTGGLTPTPPIFILSLNLGLSYPPLLSLYPIL